MLRAAVMENHRDEDLIRAAQVIAAAIERAARETSEEDAKLL